MEIRRTVRGLKNLRYVLAAEGIGIGLFAGIAVSLFRLLIMELESLRGSLTAVPVYLTLFLLACYGVILLCLRLEPNSGGSGIPHIKGELLGQVKSSWHRALIAKIAGSASAIGAGLSVGMAGPSVQIGAMAGKGLSKILKRSYTEERILLSAGAGAGLAAAFRAPLAGTIFALEEVHRNLSMELLLASLAASLSSDFISSYVFGLSPVFSIVPQDVIPLKMYWLLLLFGMMLGAAGCLYNLCTRYIQNLYDAIPWTAVRIAIPMAFCAILLKLCPDVLGGGNELVNSLSDRGLLIGSLVLLLAVKFIFSMLSFGSGTPGGIFFPMLVLGALQGAIFAEATGNETYLENFIILGMAGCFTAIVKAPVTGIILISEMTGSLSHLLSLVLVCLFAYVISDVLGTQPIYDQLLDRILSKQGIQTKHRKRKVLLDSYVQAGSYMDGRMVKELAFPAGALIISIERGSREIVPGGSTQLIADDNIIILCDESLIYDTEQILTEKCRRIN